jgi:hypothetical protein
MSLTKSEVRQMIREEIRLAFNTLSVHARNERFRSNQEAEAMMFSVIDTVALKTVRSTRHGEFCRGRIFSHVECNCGADEEE